MAWVFSTSGQALNKAGAGKINSTTWNNTISGQFLFDLSNEIEDYLCGIARSDLITNYGSLTANGKKILQKASSSFIAQNIIMFDTSGYYKLREAESKMDLLDNDIVKAETILKEDRNKSYLGIT